MKSLFTALALCASIGICAAQSTSAETSAAPDTEETPVFKKNNVKINLTSLALNNYSLSYERSLTRKVSFVAGYSLMPSTNVGEMNSTKMIAEKFFFQDEDGDIQEHLNNANFGDQSFTGELRLYLGKHAGPRGFYVAAYGRQTNMQFDYLDTYEPMMGDDIPLPYIGKLNGFGGGLMIGAQWLISNRITLDWYIAGAHYGKLGGDISVKQDFSRLSESEKRELEAEAEERFTVGGRKLIDATITNEGAHGKVDAPFLGVRGFGFNLGIAF